ncbi:DUF4864 domain-containing protein [Actibacterium sp. 188UL27-1]|uniref:DUF4864 domain-containing protein n=1 Tax=Actibacterium sp. 188UL27-1 TaxID=2786961 RepID=UPI00195D5FCC|nr:DUF4864 domain-containing protein [Actibacterium sp. 188UL27-1]MBM7069347.1 DUF4864 domain-containing protein [Actibacterium sp. 188UL27-1]
MRRLVGVILLGLTLASSAWANDAQRGAVTGVIQSQIDAFMEDDFDRAFTFASPNIRGLFGTPDNFERMVKQGYPMVWRPADVSYGQTENGEGRVLQNVVIRDADGVVHVLEYEMIPASGSWQINGVRLVKAAELGA